MTREEGVKEIFESILDAKSKFDSYGIKSTEYNIKVNEKFFDALDIVIKALEQLPEIKDAYDKGYKDGQKDLAVHLELCKEEAEPCEDCVSRQSVLSMQYRIDDSATLSTRDVVNVDDIEDLPLVMPKPKTAHWIYKKEIDSSVCSACGSRCPYDNFGSIETNYCPNCGLLMKKDNQDIVEVLDKIKAEIKEWYWQADKQALAKDPGVVDAMIDLFIRTIDKYKEESGDKK